jgi:hypothetical protein
MTRFCDRFVLGDGHKANQFDHFQGSFGIAICT